MKALHSRTVWSLETLKDELLGAVDAMMYAVQCRKGQPLYSPMWCKANNRGYTTQHDAICRSATKEVIFDLIHI